MRALIGELRPAAAFEDGVHLAEPGGAEDRRRPNLGEQAAGDLDVAGGGAGERQVEPVVTEVRRRRHRPREGADETPGMGAQPVEIERDAEVRLVVIWMASREHPARREREPESAEFVQRGRDAGQELRRTLPASDEMAVHHDREPRLAGEGVTLGEQALAERLERNEGGRGLERRAGGVVIAEMPERGPEHLPEHAVVGIGVESGAGGVGGVAVLFQMEKIGRQPVVSGGSGPKSSEGCGRGSGRGAVIGVSQKEGESVRALRALGQPKGERVESPLGVQSY